MSYIIDRIEGNDTNAWKYWVTTPVNGNALTLGATLNFTYDVGRVVLNAGSSFNGNGFSLNFASIRTTGMQLFDLQGGTTSNISIGTSTGTKGILLINTLNNNTNTIMDGNLIVNGNLSVSNILTANDFYPSLVVANVITSNVITANTMTGNVVSNNIVSNNIVLNGNDIQRILNNKIDNSTINMMFTIKGNI